MPTLSPSRELDERKQEQRKQELTRRSLEAQSVINKAFTKALGRRLEIDSWDLTSALIDLKYSRNMQRGGDRWMWSFGQYPRHPKAKYRRRRGNPGTPITGALIYLWGPVSDVMQKARRTRGKTKVLQYLMRWLGHELDDAAIRSALKHTQEIDIRVKRSRPE